MDPGRQIEAGADGTDDAMLAIETGSLADLIDGFDAGAMGSDEIGEAEFAQFASRPGERFVARIEEMEAANGRMDGRLADRVSGVFEGVDDAGMAASGEDDEAGFGVKDEGHIFGDGVFDLAFGGDDAAGSAPVSFRVFAGDRAGEPDAGVNLGGFIDRDELAAGSLVGGLQEERVVPFFFVELAGAAGEEDSFADVARS